jgi:hypothetical protein
LTISGSSSSSFPVLGLLRPVTGVESFHLFKGLPKFLFPFGWYWKSFLGSCQHALSNFSYTDIWILLCEICNSVKISSQRDNCYISAGGNAGTHRVCPEALKAATLPLDYHSLG